MPSSNDVTGDVPGVVTSSHKGPRLRLTASIPPFSAGADVRIRTCKNGLIVIEGAADPGQTANVDKPWLDEHSYKVTS